MFPGISPFTTKSWRWNGYRRISSILEAPLKMSPLLGNRLEVRVSTWYKYPRNLHIILTTIMADTTFTFIVRKYSTCFLHWAPDCFQRPSCKVAPPSAPGRWIRHPSISLRSSLSNSISTDLHPIITWKRWSINWKDWTPKRLPPNDEILT